MALSVHRVVGALPLLVACGPLVGNDDDDDELPDGLTCDMYDPTPEIGPEVTIEIRHQGTAPVFFRPQGCGGAIPFDITRDRSPIFYADTECSPNTCDGFVGASDCSVGCSNCAWPTAGRIDPGAVGTIKWSGRTLTELPLIPECAPADDCPSTCFRPEQAEPGTYEIGLPIHRTCNGSCECDGPICTVAWDDAYLFDTVLVTATIDYPAQTAVEIVITD